MQVAAQIEKIPEDEDYELVIRAAELCNPFLDSLGEVTLMPRGPLPAAILNWSHAIFRPHLQPLLLKVLVSASEGGSFEISTLDCALEAALPISLRLASRDAGKRLVQGLLAPRGDRLLERYRVAVLAGDSPGHLAVIHALRAAVFHLPPRVMIASYLVQEGRGAGLNDREIARALIGALVALHALTPTSSQLTEMGDLHP